MREEQAEDLVADFARELEEEEWHGGRKFGELDLWRVLQASVRSTGGPIDACFP